MGIKKDESQKQKQRVQSVLKLLNKQSPLTIKQEKFCNNGCVERFLKAKRYNVNKSAKLLRNCLAWRDSLGIDTLIADEFSAELAEGVAYVAGPDHELRPVMIFRINQNSQKLFIRLLVFTLEVAIQTMAKNVDQFVLLLDASLFRSASAFMNMLLATLKIVADYYPARLHKAFVIDPPSLFTYLWMGVRPFIDLSSVTTVVSSSNYEESLDYNDNFTSHPLASSQHFDSSSVLSSAKVGSCSSSRFSFTVSHHFDSVKPWYLSLTDVSASKVGPTNSLHALSGPIISPHSTRSHSFTSPITRSAPRGNNIDFVKKNFISSTPKPQKTQKVDMSMIHRPRTPMPSFLRSPALFFCREPQVSRVDKSRESFVPFLKFYRRPYDETIYRSKMRPPLSGLVSIVSPQFKRKHMSISHRF
ncbi:hypothetical protein CASFOL_005360 [Castilleja foliolosa]|uniref:CRAL-TRIO domain-containing protein n=1 Tax=Castilleja foliolosa TaxID=1961234 RepID=A0ABD3E3T3_9LAMI